MSDNEDSTVLLSVTSPAGLQRNEEERDIQLDPKHDVTARPPNVTPGSSSFLFISASMAALGGLLFGYDIGIISTALPQITKEFSLNCFEQEMVVSIMLVGALFATVVGGSFIDKLGSRTAIIINAVIFIAGALLLAFSHSYSWLLTGRFVVGFAVALSAVSECIYISEISTPRNRGMLVSLNEVAITVGFLLAYIVGLAFVAQYNGWRYMFGLSSIPALGQLLGMLKLPHSPNYLMFRHRDQEAEDVVKQLRGLTNADAVRQELTHIRLSLEDGRSASCWTLCSGGSRSAMLIAFGLVMGQQFTGQPNVLNYASTIFQQVGFCGGSLATAALPTVGLGIVKLAATVLSLLLIDRMGRRKTLLLGAIVMAASLVCLSTFAFVHQRDNPASSPCVDEQAALANTTTIRSDCDPSSSDVSPVLRYLALVSLMSYVAAYSFSFGPVVWLLLSEIFPPSIKGRAMAVSTSVNWAANLLISATFLRTIQLLTLGGVFCGYAVLTVISVVFIFLAVPETRNKPLHRIAKELETTTFTARIVQHGRQLPCLNRSTCLLKMAGNYSQLDGAFNNSRNNGAELVMETLVS